MSDIDLELVSPRSHMARTTILLGILTGLLGVAIGAFGAHGLNTMLADVEPESAMKRAKNFATGAEYQMYHALALLALGLWKGQPGRVAKARGATLCFTLGIVLFSGSLYLYGLTGITKFGMITPLGGTLLIAGWAIWGYAALRETG